MDERTCGNCGATSAAGAEYCWQCLTRFGPPAPGGAPSRDTALTAALGRGPGAGTPAAVLTEPATVTRWQPVHGSARATSLRWLVRIVVLVVAAVAGYVGYQWLFGGFPFPDQVAGQPRMESEMLEDFEDLMDGVGATFDVDVEMALYGSGIPHYFLAAAEVPSGQSIDQFYEGFVAGSGLSAEGLADPNAVTCSGLPGGVGAQCSWVQDETVVLLQGFLSPPEDLQGAAEEVRAELG
jgi:hypothetical protein